MLVALGLGARLAGLGAGEFWADEGYTGLLTGRGLGFLLEETARDVHPPLSYLLVQALRTLTGSSSEFVQRLPSALASAAGVLLAALTYRRALGRWGALLATGLLAFSPLHLMCAQEARMYGLSLLLGAGLLATYLRWRDQGRTRDLVAVGLLEVLLVHTHYFHWLLVGALALDGFLGPAPRRRAWAAAQGAVLLASLPWLAFMLPRKLAVPARSLEWREPLSLLAALPRTLGVAAVWTDGRVSYSGTHPAWWLPWALLALAQAAGRPSRAPGGARRTAWVLVGLPLLACAAAQPFLGELHWLPRYLVAATPAFALLLGDAVERLLARLSRGIQAPPAVGLLAVLGMGALGFATGPRARFVAPFVQSLPDGSAQELLVTLGGRWSVAYAMDRQGRSPRWRWVMLNPLFPERGPSTWTPADGLARDPLGGALEAPAGRILAAAENPGDLQRIRVLATSFVLRERPRARDFLRRLSALWGPPRVQAGLPADQGFQVLVFERHH